MCKCVSTNIYMIMFESRLFGILLFLCICASFCVVYPRGVMVKVMDGGIEVSKFELQSRNNVHFRKNTVERYEPPYPLRYGLNFDG